MITIHVTVLAGCSGVSLFITENDRGLTLCTENTYDSRKYAQGLRDMTLLSL